MKIAIYARVSTRDKDQDPDTQLRLLRQWAQDSQHEIYKEYIDQASALDIRRRHQWRALMQDAKSRKFQVVLVYKLDRAFRSMAHLYHTLDYLQHYGVEFKSYSDPIDTTSPTGRLLMNILGSFAEFERDLISERVRAGMARAREKGQHFGRPRRDYDVENIIFVFRSCKSISETARRTGVNKGSVRDRLIEEGIIIPGVEKEVKKSAMENGADFKV